jgi:hypothetical protein
LHLNFDYDWGRLRSSPTSRTHRHDIISKLMSAFVSPQQPNCRPGYVLAAPCSRLLLAAGLNSCTYFSQPTMLDTTMALDVHPPMSDWRRIVLSNHLRDEFPSERCQDADSRRRWFYTTSGINHISQDQTHPRFFCIQALIVRPVYSPKPFPRTVSDNLAPETFPSTFRTLEPFSRKFHQ